MLLKNKLTLITGANRGIGLSIVKKFSENGSNIIACARSKSSKFEEDILNISKKIIDEAIKRVPLKRAADPEEISNVVLFLGSDLSSYVNGEVVFVTGGY